jgi:hypothetical protein
MVTTTGIFADDTVILTSHEDPVTAARRLQSHLETWLKKWRVIINETKSLQVTFTLKKGKCPAVYKQYSTTTIINCKISWVPFRFQAYMEAAYCQKKESK